MFVLDAAYLIVWQRTFRLRSQKAAYLAAVLDDVTRLASFERRFRSVLHALPTRNE